MSSSAEFLDALVRGDRYDASRVVDALLDHGTHLTELYLEIVQPAMLEIGCRWERNELSVADEHRASAIAQAVMGRAFERVYRWHDKRTLTLVASCAEGERHRLGLRMICDLLEISGWDTSYLGESVPVESLVDFAVKRRPNVVAISVTTAPNVGRVRDVISAIRAAMPVPPVIIVGGRAIGGDIALARLLGADLTAADAREAVRVLVARFAQTDRTG